MYFKIISRFLLIPVVLSSSKQVLEGPRSKEDGGSSLVFVFDTTGSMYDDLKQLREGAEMIMDTALEQSNVITNFVFVPFHDPAVGPATVTRNKTEFKAALNRVRVKGGGDCPEKSLGGILKALEVSQPSSYVYVLTDATAGDHRLVDSVLDAVQRKETQIVFVLTGHCNDLDKPHYKVYQRIAAASAGQVFNLNKTSVHNVLDFVRSSLKGRTVNLGSVVNPAGYNYTQEIPVDRTLSEVTVSVSGAKPGIRVLDPSGQQITGPPKLVTTLDLSEIMVVKVIQPEPGNWSITVGSEEEYSVRVVGQSNLTFRHGFSVHRPGSANETSHRPLQGTLNYMLISLTEAEQPVAMKYAEVLTLDGKTLFEVPLKAQEGKGMYLAEPFVPPEDFFYIAINGNDENNQELRRVGATAIRAKLADPPYITAPQSFEGRLHDSLTLACQVESLVPVTVTWVKDAKRQTVSNIQSTVLDYTIQDLNEESAGEYRCVAKNNAGVTTASTQVTLIVQPPQVSLAPTEAAAFVGEQIEVSCNVFSESPLLKFQLIRPGSQNVTELPVEIASDGYYKYNDTIAVAENSSGVYMCVAANKGGETNSTMQIKVQLRPEVKILGPHTLTADVQSNLLQTCDIKYAKTNYWLAPNGSEVTSPHLLPISSSQLVVMNVSLADEGVWSCVGVGGNGFEARDTFYLNVTMKPRVTIEGPPNQTLIYGSDVSIVCNVRAKPMPEQLLWRKRNREIFNTTILNPQTNVYSTTLTLRNITAETEGYYECYAENDSGYRKSASVLLFARKNMTLIEGFTDQSVNLYSQVELRCMVDSYPYAQIDWYHNGTKLVPSDTLQMAPNNTRLIVNSIDFSHLGYYACKASNQYENITINGTLTVDDLESPVLSKEPARIKSLGGNSTVVTCRIIKGKPLPGITWQFRSETSSDFSNIPEGSALSEDKLELSIDDVNKHHSGVYRCVAENILGRDVYEANVVVQYPPQLTSEPAANLNATREVEAGETVTFSCQVSGSPTPLVVWTKDGRPIPFTSHIYLTDGNDLVLEETTEYDSGVFTCTASSALGATEKNFTLFVFVPPTITNPELERELDIIEGQLVELPCFARGVPKPALEWRQNGEPITEGDRKYIDEDFVLRFVANLTDFGDYTCVASNQYGNTSFTFSVYIWVQPYIEPPLVMEVVTVTGRNASLNCSAIAFPVPTITWEFQQQPFTVNTSDLSYNDVGNLFISNVEAKHAGVYTCVAENDVGVAMKTIALDVNEPPWIEPDNFTGPYIATDLDESLKLPCEVRGKPEPFVAWSKDGHYIDKDDRYGVGADGSLTIKSPSEDLSGVYLCVAKNKAGVANRSVEAQIYSLPTPMLADGPQPSLTILEGTNHTLECPVRATRNFTLKWYKDGLSLPTSVLTNVSRDNASSYTCSVSNAVGIAHASVLIDVQWPPKFVTQVETNVEVVRGDDYALNCAVDASPVAKTKWLFNSRPLIGESKDHLRLKDIRLHQMGDYKCVVSNEHGTVVREFTLDVLVPPFISIFDFLEVQLREGANATLACEASGSPTPTVTWSHDNSKWHLQTETLRVYNASTESQGLFRCEARNKAGTAHLVYQVTVVAPAKVTEVVLYGGGEGTTVLGAAELKLNTKTRLACHATGNPTPRTQWLRNGRPLSENTPTVSYADLVFDRVLSSHAGAYSCLTTNDGGADERRVRIKVIEPPQISTSQFETLAQNKTKSIEVLSGQAFHLHCHAYGDPPPQILWYKAGDQLRLDAGGVDMNVAEFGEILVVNKAAYGHSGNYTCVARNKVGESAFSYLVEVLVPPSSPTSVPTTVRVREGAPLRLRCPALGSPLPRVTWLKHAFVELHGALPRMHLSEDNVTLTINATDATDSGKYTCVMVNKVGATELSYSVSVERAPSSGDETIVTSLHRSIVLYCRADGLPTPSVYWYKDNKPLAPSADVQLVLEGNILTIWRVKPEDAGQYVCVAQNSAGIGYRRIHLQVIVPGSWSVWSPWSLCNVTCGAGHQSRSRRCQFAASDVTDDRRWTLDERECKGPKVDRRRCHMPPCEEAESKPHWSNWSGWSGCSASCGVGAQTRARRCRPTGATCRGDNLQIRKCPDLLPCHSNGVADSDNDVLNNSREEMTEPNPYIPEATFELEPEVSPNYHGVGPTYPKVGPTYQEVGQTYHEVNPRNPDAEEFDTSGVKPMKVFDVALTENLDNKDDNGLCEVGFRHDNATGVCEDIDECLIVNNHCHSTQICENTAGAYRCACEPGYVALGAGQRCLDINECEQGSDNCQYACVNVAGGFVCACPRPLRLHDDRRRCVDASATSNSKPTEMEEIQDYLSATVEFPARFMKHRN